MLVLVLVYNTPYSMLYDMMYVVLSGVWYCIVIQRWGMCCSRSRCGYFDDCICLKCLKIYYMTLTEIDFKIFCAMVWYSVCMV